MKETLKASRSGRPSLHVPIRAERPTPDSHTLPLVRNETVRARKRDTVAESHFQSNISCWMGWYVAVSPCHAISHNVNIILLQSAPNLLNLLLIHTTNTNAAVNLAVTILHNFKLKRDTVQTKNDVPAQ